MLPDLVWFVRSGPNEEFRYSLRSLTANVPHGGVRVIGFPPAWFEGVALHPPLGASKNRNTTLAMRLAIDSEEISDPFVYCNDDFFVFEQVASAPVFARGSLAEIVERYRATSNTSPYAAGAAGTLALLERAGFEDPWNFETHTPLLVHKAAMRAALDLVDAASFSVPYKRSIYGALAGLEPEVVKDPKVFTRYPVMPKGPWLSTNDESFTGRAGAAVRRAFPDPCAYERR